MPTNLPKLAIVRRVFKSLIGLMFTSWRPVLLVILWCQLFPLLVRESVWLLIIYSDDFLTNSHVSKSPFVDESVENTIVTIAKYFPVFKELKNASSSLPKNSLIWYIHIWEGACIFFAYLFLGFVVVMVREWIVQHEVPVGLREGGNIPPGINQNLFGNPLAQNPAAPVQQPPQPRVPPLLAERMRDLHERLQQDPHLIQVNRAEQANPPQQPEGVNNPENGLPNPQQDLQNHQFNAQLLLDALQFANNGNADNLNNLRADPVMEPPVNDDLEGEDVGDEFDGILQFIGVGGPVINIFVNFSWVYCATILISMVLVTLPFVVGRIAVGLTGVLLALWGHLSIHLGNITVDLTMLLLHKSLGLSIGSLTDASFEAIIKRPVDLTYVTKLLTYFHSPHPKSFFNCLLYIFLGNFLIIMAFVWYVNSTWRFASSFNGQRAELAVLRLLRHVGDILKVIVITGVELVTFPIFCGILVSFALLPLFNDTIYDRVIFTMNHPLDSPLIYWFAGTFYMFQLAMFVTMCREIMRPGVLYFVRDPNDPNFHPIKEVLERPLIPQLKKIAISAVMYAILICVCIGGLIWPMRYTFNATFLPLTFDMTMTKSAIASRKFVVTQIFLQVIQYVLWRHFRPIRIIRNTWEAVFLRACGDLRLSSFLLNRPMPRERGTIHYGSFMAWFNSVQPDYSKPGTIDDLKTILPDQAIYVLDGTYVRAPATDSAAAKKELKLFIEVNKDDARVDEQEDGATDLKEYSVVYTPPRFRLRVFGLLCVIWGVGALVVFSVTGLPIIFGKFLLSFQFTMKEVNGNNILAFYVGLGPTLLAICAVDWRTEINEYCRITFQKSKENLRSIQEQPQRMTLILSTLKDLAIRQSKLVIFAAIYFTLVPVLLLYTLHKFILEPLQPLLPLSMEDLVGLYEIIFICYLVGFALGLTHLRTAYPNNAISRSLNRIFQNGYMDIDIVFACRVLIQPIIAFVVLHFIPQTVRFIGDKLLNRGYQYTIVLIMRNYSYVCAIVAIVLAAFTFILEFLWHKWETRFRDEVYLVTEQLENLDR